MVARAVVSIGLILLCASDASLAGQVSAVAPGSRVRLRTGSSKLEGQVVRVDADFVSLVPSVGTRGPIAIPAAQVQSVDVWRGRASQWRSGAEIGSFAGFVTASAVFAARMRHCVGAQCAKSGRWVAYGAAGSLAGAIVGGLVGAVFQHDRWERISLGPAHPQIAVRAGGQGIAFSIRF